jgi:curved DNA-binding protein CbpA
METGQSHYELLGVRHDATPEAIRDAYRRAVSASHPDAGPEAEKAWREKRTVELNVAYGVLKDPLARADYDARLAALLRPPEPAPAPPASSQATTTPPSPRRRARGRPAPTPQASPDSPLRRVHRLVATPAAGWTLVLAATFLGNWFGGLERAIDAFLWAGLAHFVLSPSPKSPLASIVIGTLRYIGGVITR